MNSICDASTSFWIFWTVEVGLIIIACSAVVAMLTERLLTALTSKKLRAWMRWIWEAL